MNSGIERAALMISEEKTQHDSRKRPVSVTLAYTEYVHRCHPLFLSTLSLLLPSNNNSNKKKLVHVLFSVCLRVSLSLTIVHSISLYVYTRLGQMFELFEFISSLLV